MRYSFEKAITSDDDCELVVGTIENIGRDEFGQVSRGTTITLRAKTTTLSYQLSRYKHRLDDKPWSLVGFQIRPGQDIDLLMTESLGFGKGFLDVIDYELVATSDEIKTPRYISHGPNDSVKLEFDSRDTHHAYGNTKKCVAIWMTKRMGEADSFMGGCENDKKGMSNVSRELLYCLLVVEDEKEAGRWRRIGIARAPMEYIEGCGWSEKMDMILI